jgi:predicted phosphodiesterase
MTAISRRNALRIGAAWAISPAMLTLSTTLGQAPKDPYVDGKLVDGEPRQIAKDSFTIVVMPDTQHYSERYPEQYLAQTEWIAENRKDRKIACVLHLGDVTNHNSQPEWENAVKAMNQLDEKVPYFMVPGNHDYSENGTCKDRSTGLTASFPVDKYKDLPTFGGTYDKEPDRLENSYHLFSAGGRKFLSICLEFGPRKDVLRWANEVATKHKDRAAILTTHAYMYFDDTRYDWKKFGPKQSWNPHDYPVAKATADDVSDGEELWYGLVSQHENFILTLNGHVLGDGLGRTLTSTPMNREVHQVLVNFQMRPQGGDGWLRLLEFKSDGKTVDVYDYSPTRQQRNESDQNMFTMRLA